MDIISSQVIFHMCPVEILLYENKQVTFNYIIYNKVSFIIQIKTYLGKTHNIEMLPVLKAEIKKTTYILYINIIINSRSNTLWKA